MKLSTDSRVAHLSLTGDYSARELETLISDLAALRGQMTPEVPTSRPLPPQETSADRVLTQDEPTLEAVRLTDGRIRFWIRHQGLGWLVYNFPVGQAVVLRDFFIDNTPDDDTIPSLFREDGGQTH